jgi:hypothetical protein
MTDTGGPCCQDERRRGRRTADPTVYDGPFGALLLLLERHLGETDRMIEKDREMKKRR